VLLSNLRLTSNRPERDESKRALLWLYFPGLFSKMRPQHAAIFCMAEVLAHAIKWRLSIQR
jgi:hypothetical protein